MTMTTHICNQLSLERCRQYIAHIHALVYMETSALGKKGTNVSENVHSLLSLLDQELQESQRRLAVIDSKTGAAPRRKTGRNNIYPFPEQADASTPPRS